MKKKKNRNINNNDLTGYIPNIPSLNTCGFEGTDLCIISGEKNSCGSNLRTCTDEDIENTNKLNQTSSDNDNNDNNTTNNKNNNEIDSDETKKSGGSSIATILIVIVIIIILILAGYYFYRRYQQKQKNDEYIPKSSSQMGMLESSQSTKTDKSIVNKGHSFVVLSSSIEKLEKEEKQRLELEKEKKRKVLLNQTQKNNEIKVQSPPPPSHETSVKVTFTNNNNKNDIVNKDQEEEEEEEDLNTKNNEDIEVIEVKDFPLNNLKNLHQINNKESDSEFSILPEIKIEPITFSLNSKDSHSDMVTVESSPVVDKSIEHTTLPIPPIVTSTSNVSSSPVINNNMLENKNSINNLLGNNQTVIKDSESYHSSVISITQEQYQTQMQYQNLINSQNFYY